MTVAGTPQRLWRFPRLLLEDHLALALMIWAGFVVEVMAVAIGIAFFSDVTGSVMVVASSFAAWHVAFLTGYVAYRHVPRFIAHGQTRRGAGIQLATFMGVFAAIDALLITISYLIEYGFYALASWPRDLSGEHLFSSHLDAGMIFAEYWLIFLVWAAAGGLVGVAFYRYGAGGWLALVPAGILMCLAGVNSGQAFMRFVLQSLPAIETTSPALFTVLALASFLVAIAMTWSIVRDVPLRTR